MSDSRKRPGWWRRFRSLPTGVQAATWAGLVILIIVGGFTGGGDDAGNSTTAVTTPAPPTSPPVAPTTGPPPAPATSLPGPATSLPGPATSRPRPSASPPAPATRPPSPTARSTPPSGSALAGLATLPVKGRAPKTGYSRAEFGQAWTDDVTVADGHNGCDTRNDILRRDLTDVVIKAGTHGCVVASGALHDPYTAAVIAFTRGQATSEAVQIDHVVSLSDAWQTGAQQLSLAARTNLANDPLNLLAVSGAANEQKSDSDAASWLPPNKAFRCSYVAIQVAVKMRYHLWVTRAEHDAIARVLSACPRQTLPSGGPPPATSPTAKAPPATPRSPSAARTGPAPTPTSQRPGARVVRPGAYCSPAGARGVTSAGTPMICKLDSTGRRLRWSKG